MAVLSIVWTWCAWAVNLLKLGLLIDRSHTHSVLKNIWLLENLCMPLPSRKPLSHLLRRKMSLGLISEMLIIPLLCHLESEQPSNGKSIGHFVDVQARTYLADLQLSQAATGSILQALASRLWCTALVEMGLSYSRVDLISVYVKHVTCPFMYLLRWALLDKVRENYAQSQVHLILWKHM